jgi:hypothetical protein
MIKNREEVEKEFWGKYNIAYVHDKGFAGLGQEIIDDISKIRKDDIDGLVEWANKEYPKGDFNANDFDKINTGYKLAFSDIIDYLQKLKEKV